jgi:hypothetical protein
MTKADIVTEISNKTGIDRNDVLGSSLRHFNRVTDEELHEYVTTRP